SPPPVSGNASADCVGVANDAAEFSLWLSPHIMRNIDRILSELFKWELAQIDAYLTALTPPSACASAPKRRSGSHMWRREPGQRGRRHG
ncbi:MAG: hypothetical protein JWN00_2359, partial [Actinomycetia bacterium]|nr:hypothetical protein [Actinomycetes bacterium]